ncbi:DEAD-box ATP-dependent RNA helicase 42 [Ceratobasidium sp. AG-Ba]|nr:DEAD-box ATP-dependent RNA helicase 42 [Ceratobasidium sp. AG-Ba]
MVGPSPLNLTDHDTLVVPAFQLTDQYSCSGDGLRCDKITRMLPEKLKEWANGPTPEGLGKEEMKMYRCRPLWEAQCNMFLLPDEMPPSNSNIPTMKKHLSTALRTRQSPPPAVLALEASANQQFSEMVKRLKQIVSTTQFIPISEGSKEGPKHTNHERPHKRRNLLASLAVIYETPTPEERMGSTPPRTLEPEDEIGIGVGSPSYHTLLAESQTDAVGTGQLPPPIFPGSSRACFQAKKHQSRGDCKSGAINTARYRLRAPQTAAQSYLLQLMVDLGNLERAISVTERSNSPGSPPTCVPPNVNEQDLDLIVLERSLRKECRSLVTACISGLENADTASYESMRSHSWLALWYLRAKKVQPTLTVTQAWKRYIKGSGLNCTLSKFRHLHSNGHNLVQLMNAASVHILSIIAVSALRDVTHHLCEPEISEIENALQQPEIIPGTFGSLVSAGIVQVAHQLERQFSNGAELGERLFGIDRDEDDRYLGELLSYGRTDYTQAGRGSAWFGETSGFPSPPTIDEGTHLCPTFVIKTNFDPERKENKLLPPELEADPGRNAEFTEQQGHSTSGPGPRYLRCIRKTSVCKADNYVKITKELYTKSNILVHGKGGREKGFLCLVFGKEDTLRGPEERFMTEITRITLQVEKNEVVDTSEAGPRYVYPAYHYGAWGKMAKSGKLAPKELHPRLFLGDLSQPAPYLDRAVRILADCFNKSHFMHCPHDQFNRAIEILLPVAVEKLRREVPGLWAKHQELFDSLNPATTLRLGSSPFCMTVLNVQPATRAHRDSSDELDSICLIADRTSPGAFCAIRSKRNLHFNPHFKGQRFSYVFTSDAGLRRWEERRNDMKCLQSIHGADTTEETDNFKEEE